MNNPLYLDTLDDRRELHRLLTRLSPARRLRFLEWCCAKAIVPHSEIHPGPSRTVRELAELARRDSSADERHALDVFLDIWVLSIQYELDLDDALAALVNFVRGRELPAVPSLSSLPHSIGDARNHSNAGRVHRLGTHRAETGSSASAGRIARIA